MPDSVITITENSLPEVLEQFTFTFTGALQPWTGTGRMYLEGPYSVNHIRLTLAAAADRDVVVDIKRNGTSIYSSPPRIPAGELTAVANTGIVIPSFSKGDYLTLDIVQAGLTQTGQHLVANLRLKRFF